MAALTVMERTGEKAVFNGNVSVRIPQDQSALCLVDGAMSVYDGDDYVSEPHWIVNQRLGTRRKQFRRIGGTEGPLVWTYNTTAEAVGQIESRYYAMHLKMQEFYKTTWKEALDALKNVKKAHVIPIRHLGNHCGYTEEDENIWEYHYSEIPGVGDSFGFDWVQTPAKMKNVRVGKLMYEMERKCEILRNRKWKFYEAFMECVSSYIYKNCKLYRDNTSPFEVSVCMVRINGREYAFECGRRHGIIMLDTDRLPDVS